MHGEVEGSVDIHTSLPTLSFLRQDFPLNLMLTYLMPVKGDPFLVPIGRTRLQMHMITAGFFVGAGDLSSGSLPQLTPKEMYVWVYYICRTYIIFAHTFFFF